MKPGSHLNDHVSVPYTVSGMKSGTHLHDHVSEASTISGAELRRTSWCQAAYGKQHWWTNLWAHS